MVDDVDETGCLFRRFGRYDVDFPDSISMLAFVSNPLPHAICLKMTSCIYRNYFFLKSLN
jgi:hypothetical protein